MTHLTIQQLVAQTDAELSGPSLTLVEKHLSECEICWQEMERLAAQDALLVSIATIDPGEAFFEDLAASVEAEISGKKKPASRPAARPAAVVAPAPAPARDAPRVVVRPAPPFPIAEPEVVSAAPAFPSAEPEATNPVPAFPSAEPEGTIPESVAPSAESETAVPEPFPAVNFDAPPAGVPERLPVDPVGAWSPPAPGAPDEIVIERGGVWTHSPPPEPTEPTGDWTPPKPTLEDPFADLGLPRRSGAASTPKPAPRPVAAPAPPPNPAPRPEAKAPAPKPPPKPVVVTPAPKAIVATPVARPARTPARAAAPQPEVEIGSPEESERPSPAVPIMIGILAFIAGLAVAVVVVLRLVGPGGLFKAAPREPGAPATTLTVGAPPVTPAVEPHAAPPAPLVEPRPESTVAAPPVEQAPAPHAAARPRRKAPPAATDAADNAALGAQPTIVVPVRVIHSETTASVTPTSSAPAPAAPAPASELGILCGAVRDSDGNPVARAQVMMADVGVVVLTDRAGRFCLTAPVGERTLSVVALGFTASRRLVSLGKRTPEINLTLKSAAPFPTPR